MLIPGDDRQTDSSSSPSGVLEELEKPETFQHLFEQSVDPYFLIDLPSGTFVDVNPAFESLTGYDREQFLNDVVKADDLIDPCLVQLAREAPGRMPADRFQTRLVDRNENILVLEVSVSPVTIADRPCILGLARDVSDDRAQREQLRDQLDAVLKSNNRILTLNEKIKEIPKLTSRLLNLDHEKEIIKEARTHLDQRTGLNFSEVTFFLFDENRSTLTTFSTDGEPGSRIDADDDHAVARAASAEREFLRPSKDEFLLPIQGSDDTYGVMNVRLNSRERELMEENESVWDGYKDTVVTLSNLLGLILQNHRLIKRIHDQSIRDELTGIHNRRFFNRKLDREVDRAVRYHHPLSLLVIDVDSFKGINDTYGHQEGDRILRKIAEVFEENCRKSDIACRYGGDEFGLILPETDLESAKDKARMLLDTFGRKEFVARSENGTRRRLQISVSVGLSCLPARGSFGISREQLANIGADKLLSTADRCLYEAKATDDSNLVTQEDFVVNEEPEERTS